MFRRRYNILLNRYALNRKRVFIDRDIKLIFEKKENKDEIMKEYKLSSKDLNLIKDKKNIKNYSLIQSIFIYKLLFSLGNVIDAIEFRTNFINIFAKKDFKNSDEFLDVLKALIDNGDFDFAYNLTSKFHLKFIFSPKYYFNYIYIRNINSLLSKIINKKHYEFFNLNPIIGNKGEINFKSLIKSKTLALVGPGYSNIENGNEIDKYDLVIRLNLFKDYHDDQKKFYGSKTGIIYFNGEMFRKIEKNGISELHKDKYLCTRLDFSDRFHINLNRSTRKLNLNLSGTNGFIQDIIVDLLHYDFKKLKIFNIDFFLNKNLYFSDYSKQGDMKKSKMYLTQSKLDLFSNINFIRNLEGSGIIEVDNVLKEILSYSNSNIAEKFKNLYQNYT